MKRLRKKTNSYYYEKMGTNNYYKLHPIRYFACGEYGTKTKRPHYHALIFNLPDPVFIRDAWSLLDSNGHPVQFGKIDVGNITSDSAAYCVKYLDKEKVVGKFKRDDREKEFQLQSQGYGLSYLNQNTINFHRNNPERMFLTKPGGHKIAMPPYYRKKIFTEEERRKQMQIIKRQIDQQKEIKELQDKIKGITPNQRKQLIKEYQKNVKEKFKFLTNQRNKL